MKHYSTASHVFTSPKGRPVTMLYRLDTNDWNTTWSCLNEDEYGLRHLPELNGRALDIGAYTGGCTLALLVDNPTLRVTAIEPVPWNADLIRINADRNGVGDRLVVREAAVGDTPGATMRVHYGYEGNELAEHHAFVGNMSLIQAGLALDKCPSDVPHDHAVVPTLTYDDLVPPQGLAFAKIDCEGGEWHFLTDAARIERIHGEAHPTEGHVMADLARYLGPRYAITWADPPADTDPAYGPLGFEAVLQVAHG
jgi:FkbM family methyltransferase